MACFSPLQGYRSRKGGITFKHSESIFGQPFNVPCGQCIGCRIKKSRDWAARCHHEASLHKENSFLTLTYDNKHLPKYPHSLDKKHLSKFIKALRNKIHPKKVRFFACGEYGQATEKNNYIARPHFHIILFGHDWPDKQFFTESNGTKLFTSPTLTKIWGNGHASTGTVTLESAGYVARYALKKITGKLADDHYLRCDPDTGEAVWLQPEFNQMSLRPGIGYDWFKKYTDDVFPDDFVIIKGKKIGTPRYYLQLLGQIDPMQFQQIKAQRLQTMQMTASDNTPDRLISREICLQARTNNLKRTL